MHHTISICRNPSYPYPLPCRTEIAEVILCTVALCSVSVLDLQLTLELTPVASTNVKEKDGGVVAREAESVRTASKV